MRDDGRDGVRIERRGLGFAARGPGFYVWDLEPRAVLESALLLAHPAGVPRRAPLVTRERRPLREPER